MSQAPRATGSQARENTGSQALVAVEFAFDWLDAYSDEFKQIILPFLKSTENRSTVFLT